MVRAKQFGWLKQSISAIAFAGVTFAATMASAPAVADEVADVEYMTALGLMKGHMMVAKELMDLGSYDEAEQHISHPVEELYADVAESLPEKGVEDFDATLIELQDLFKVAPEDPAVLELYEESQEAIDGAIAALPEESLKSPKFVLAAIGSMLATADEEYGAGIADGVVVEFVEYQDSRGFVFYAEEMLETVSEQLADESPQTLATVTDAMTELKTAWPEVTPPEELVKTPEEVSELVETIQASAAAL